MSTEYQFKKYKQIFLKSKRDGVHVKEMLQINEAM